MCITIITLYIRGTLYSLQSSFSPLLRDCVGWGSFGSKTSRSRWGRRKKLTFSQFLRHARNCAGSVIYGIEVKCLTLSLRNYKVSRWECPPKSVHFLCRILFFTSCKRSSEATLKGNHHRERATELELKVPLHIDPGSSLYRWGNWGTERQRHAPWSHNDLVADPDNNLSLILSLSLIYLTQFDSTNICWTFTMCQALF